MEQDRSTTISRTVSPWTYLGHDRFVALAQRSTARQIARQADRISAKSFRCRAACRCRSARRSGRRIGWSSLQRWSRRSSACRSTSSRSSSRVNGDLADALDPRRARNRAQRRRSMLAGAIMRARWDRGARHRRPKRRWRRSPRTCGLDPHALAARANASRRSRRVTAHRRRRRSTRGVFGAPDVRLSRTNCSGDRIGSTSSPANWQNSVLFAGRDLPGRSGRRDDVRRRESRQLYGAHWPRPSALYEDAARGPSVHQPFFTGSNHKPCPQDSSSRSFARWRRSSSASIWINHDPR